MANEEPTLNVPSLITLAAVAYFLIRWFFKSENSDGTGMQSRRNQGRIEQVNQISQMFPQLDRRAIMWDLHRNGGSMTATTERILSGTGLETPPLTYQPDIPPPPSQAAPTARNPDAAQSKSASESLIARYNLADKVRAEDEGAGQELGSASRGSSPSTTPPVWSQNKTERQRLLQQRRDEMILAARRKLLEKEKAKSSGNDAS